MERLTRAKAIRAKCLECSNMSRAEVRKCPVTGCALYPFRMGKEDKTLYDCDDSADEDELE